jgi:hypothetical protein
MQGLLRRLASAIGVHAVSSPLPVGFIYSTIFQGVAAGVRSFPPEELEPLNLSNAITVHDEVSHVPARGNMNSKIKHYSESQNKKNVTAVRPMIS